MIERVKNLAAVVVLAGLALLVPCEARAQGPEHVLVVANAASPDSVRIAEAYARRRAIPDAQVLRLADLPGDPPDDIVRAEYEARIEAPIAQWLRHQAAQDRIHYIVLTKGIPLRVRGTGGRQGTVASVDSELTLLYRKMTGQTVLARGTTENPYFLDTRPVSEALPFSHERYDIYLVTRLDGFTVDDVLAVIDRGASPVAEGRFVLDQKFSWFDKGNEWLRAAATRLQEAGWADRVLLEQTGRVAADVDDVLGYYSWGSNDPAIRQRRFNLKFVPGALAGMFVSTDGRTFRKPRDDWQVADWSRKEAYHRGSPQSLAGDLIAEGATGVAGHVAEPFLDGTVRPDILFPAYTAGFNLAEAFYLAMPFLSWQTVIVGDPLCAPFSRPTGSQPLLTAAIDPRTELPLWFAERRMAAVGGPALDADAVAQYVKAEALLAKQDTGGARVALEKAVAGEPRLVIAQHLLAEQYESVGQFDLAAERYRAILEEQPDNAIALNNLAYHLAMRKDDAEGALPLARRAQVHAPASPAVLDTLGWVYYLLGDLQQGVKFIATAAQVAPRNPEIHVHLARVLLALGKTDAAKEALQKALDEDGTLREEDEIKSLLAELR